MQAAEAQSRYPPPPPFYHLYTKSSKQALDDSVVDFSKFSSPNLSPPSSQTPPPKTNDESHAPSVSSSSSSPSPPASSGGSPAEAKDAASSRKDNTKPDSISSASHPERQAAMKGALAANLDHWIPPPLPQVEEGSTYLKFGIPQLDPRSELGAGRQVLHTAGENGNLTDPAGDLKKLNFEILKRFQKLMDSLTTIPKPPRPDLSVPPHYPELAERVRDLDDHFSNMRHILNVLRANQGRQTLIDLLKRQIRQRVEQTEQLERLCTESEEFLLLSNVDPAKLTEFEAKVEELSVSQSVMTKEQRAKFRGE